MTATSGDALSIESVDVFARQLYRRTRNAGTDFVDLAIAVCSLHRALKHLDAEAQDPDSPLHTANPASGESRDSVYARQLRSLVEDSEFALKQVDTILQRYGENMGRRDLDSAERARKIGLIRGDVVSQTMKIEVFLDTIQLYNPAKAQRTLENVDDQQLDMIKDKVDAIANHLFHERRNQSPIEADEDELWRSFKAALEREGFSSEVLRKNKEVLRAYIRELESHQRHGDGTPPSVRGLLEWDAHPRRAMDTGSYPSHSRQAKPNSENNSIGIEGRRRTEARGMANLLPVPSQPRSPTVASLQPRLSFEPYTSSEASDSEGNPSSHMALISTRDLMALDRYSADKVATVKGASLLSPALSHLSISPGTSPSQRYLPFGTQPLHIPASALSSSFSPSSPPPPYGTSPNTLGAGWDPPALPASAPSAGNDMLQQYQPSPRRSSHLAPDSKGQTIPLDATWTKIDRRLVSPEVLEEAGVRYEARPNFVAVLGVLSREKIEEYARRSFEVRNARRAPTARAANVESRGGGRLRQQETYGDRGRGTGSRELAGDNTSEALFDASDTDSSDDDDHNNRRRGSGRSSRGRYTPKDYAPKTPKHPDSDEEDRGTRVYPVIVSPPASANGEDSMISPSSTVAPKPILKNKNPNHVRFDRSGPREISPEEVSRRDRDRDSNRRGGDRERERDRDRVRDRDRDWSKRAKSRDRSRERDRVRDTDRNRDRAQDRERDRDRDQRGRGEEERPARRSVLKEATTAIGVSSAAATLLSVLTHAAHHL